MAQDENNITYFCGRIWAELTKQSYYTADVSLDSKSVIVKSQCECGAGEGPTGHCKHIATMLYGIYRFGLDKEILTEQTCTQVFYVEK